MKKFTLAAALILSVALAAAAQNTNYGTSSGTAGTSFSHFGYFAGNASLAASTNNSFFGRSSGRLTTGSDNTAVGAFSLYTNGTGAYNTTVGSNTLYSNTNGSLNNAFGYWSLYSNSTGSGNNAFGTGALYTNTIGEVNVAFGYSAMYRNISGGHNTAVGGGALFGNTIGNNNTGVGDGALTANTTGNNNTAVGYSALTFNDTGINNTALGSNSGPSSGSGNLTNTTAIGNGATTTASNQVRVGNASVTSIGGQVGWTTLSDGRFKLDIKEDVSGLDFIKQLRPVSYAVNKKAFNAYVGLKENSGDQPAAREEPRRHTGFVAQEVEAVVKKTGYVFHGVDAPKNEKDYYGIRYEEFVVPLVKAIQELSAKVEAQGQTIVEQQQKINSLMLNDASIEKEGNDAQGAILYDNLPNPFDSETTVKMKLPEKTQQATLLIYTLEGKQLKSVTVDSRGETELKISSNELGPGMYLYTLVTDGKIVATKRMILTK